MVYTELAFHVAPAMQQPQSATSTPLLWILIIINMHCNWIQSVIQNHMPMCTVSQLESREQGYIKAMNNNNSIIANMLNHCYFQYNTQEHCSKYVGSVLYVFIKLCGWSVHTVSIVKHIQYSLSTGNSPRNYKAVIELENIYI